MAFTRVIPKFLQGYAAAGLMDKPKWQTEGGSCLCSQCHPCASPALSVFQTQMELHSAEILTCLFSDVDDMDADARAEHDKVR